MQLGVSIDLGILCKIWISTGAGLLDIIQFRLVELAIALDGALSLIRFDSINLPTT